MSNISIKYIKPPKKSEIYRDIISKSQTHGKTKPKYKILFEHFKKIKEAETILFIICTSKNYQECCKTFQFCEIDLEENNGNIKGNSFINISSNNEIFENIDIKLLTYKLNNGSIMKRGKLSNTKFTELELFFKEHKLPNQRMRNIVNEIVGENILGDHISNIIKKFKL